MLEKIDRYIEELCVPHNEAFDQALRDATAASMTKRILLFFKWWISAFG